MTQPIILSYEDPTLFKTQQVIAKQDSQGINLTYTDETLSFTEMMEYRVPVNSDEILNNMQGNGHLFANIGVGGILTFTYQDYDYLLGCNQQCSETNDTAFNPMGGYVEIKHLNNLDLAQLKEISEELLPLTSNNRLIRFLKGGQIIGKPFSDYYFDFPESIELTDLPRYQAPISN